MNTYQVSENKVVLYYPRITKPRTRIVSITLKLVQPIRGHLHGFGMEDEEQLAAVDDTQCDISASQMKELCQREVEVKLHRDSLKLSLHDCRSAHTKVI